MALPMLIAGGAECGPSNPLQGLSKRFDQDRGLQQVRTRGLPRHPPSGLMIIFPAGSLWRKPRRLVAGS